MRAGWAVCCCLSAAGAGSAHEHKAPHGGALIVFGEEFAHVELVLDGQSGKLTAYVLDGEAEKSVRVKQKEIELRLRFADKKEETVAVTLKAVSNVLTGETAGDTSQFAGEAAALKGATRFSGAIAAVSVKGQEFKDVQFKFPEGNEDKR
ncbi:MAG: hypothetical protein ABSE73_05445 [Planctomycetota bacterium]